MKKLITLMTAVCLGTAVSPVFAQDVATDDLAPVHAELVQENVDLLENATPVEDADALWAEIMTANQTVESVAYHTEAEIQAYHYESDTLDRTHLDGELIAFYDADAILEHGYGHVETEMADGSLSDVEFVMITDGTKYFYQRENESSWQAVHGQGQEFESFNLDPGYLDVIQILDSITSDMAAYETDEDYIFTIENSDVMLVDLFQQEFGLSLTGVEEQDMERYTYFIFDKETFMMEELQVSLAGLDIPDGQLILDVQTDFEDFNEVDLEELKKYQAEIEEGLAE